MYDNTSISPFFFDLSRRNKGEDRKKVVFSTKFSSDALEEVNMEQKYDVVCSREFLVQLAIVQSVL